jgi:hypothetical protein
LGRAAGKSGRPADAARTEGTQMLKHILAGVLATAATLAGAQQLTDRQAIDVEVVNGRIVVAEEDAITTDREGGLVWHIVQPGYVFPKQGINFATKGRHRCAPIDKGLRFRCAKLGHIRGERYKYAVIVVETKTKRSLEPLDPWIQNK